MEQVHQFAHQVQLHLEPSLVIQLWSQQYRDVHIGEWPGLSLCL